MSLQSLSRLLKRFYSDNRSVGQFVVVLQIVAQLNLQESGDQLLSLQDLMCPCPLMTLRDLGLCSFCPNQICLSRLFFV